VVELTPPPAGFTLLHPVGACPASPLDPEPLRRQLEIMGGLDRPTVFVYALGRWQHTRRIIEALPDIRFLIGDCFPLELVDGPRVAWFLYPFHQLPQAQAAARAGARIVASGRGEYWHPMDRAAEHYAEVAADCDELYKLADTITPLTWSFARNLMERIPEVAATRFKTIPNGIEPSSNPEPAILPNRVKKAGPVVLTLTNTNYQHKRRGIDEAAAILAPLPCTYLVAGLPGPYAPQVGWFYPGAYYLGLAEEPRATLAAADIYFHLSYQDTQSMALTEAMAEGLAPVVCVTATSGAHELIRDGATGLVVSGPKEAAAAVSHLIDHPEERQRLGEAARRYAKTALSWPTVAQRHRQVFEELF